MSDTGSWLCPSEIDRARILDNNERVRRARRITAAALGVALLVLAPWIGWWTLALFAAAALNFLTLDHRLERSDRPERVAATSLVYTEAVIAAGVALSGAGSSPLLPWMAITLVLAAARFRREVITAGAGLALAMMLAVTVGVDPSGTLADPELLIATSALMVAVVAAAGAIQSAEIHHRGQSVLDPLTGLLNRKAMAGRFVEIREQAALTGAPVCMLALDLDHFKLINDEHGHARGDAVLRDGAYAMRRSLRHFELFYRYGGEEFVVLLPGVDAESGRQVGERLRTAVEEAEPGGLKLTISVGVASEEGSDVNLATLFAAADAALYEAKSAGRNRVVAATDLVGSDPGDGEITVRTRAGRVLVGAEAGAARPHA